MAISGRLQAVKKVKVYEEIVSQITSLILEGELKPGDKLPSERELCERFGVGRNSVREAVRALESARLVDTRQGEGTFVTATPEALLQPLAKEISDDEDGLLFLFEARRILEPQIAALAAERITDGEIEGLARILERQRGEVKAGRSGMEEDTDFHLALATAAKNKFLRLLLDSLLRSLLEIREHSVREHSDRVRSVEGHAEILEAVRRRNTKMAISRMISHLLGVEGRGMEAWETREG